MSDKGAICSLSFYERYYMISDEEAKAIRDERNSKKKMKDYYMKQVFVFGSNESGIHGAGAALYAYKKKGARYGVGFGRAGQSFAIPTKDTYIQTLDLETISMYVQGFLAYAKSQYNTPFKITRIGCGLAGYKDEEIAPLFKGASHNCFFDEAWKPYLGDGYKYWGTYGK